MPAYIVAVVDVKNPESYEEYRKLAGPAVKKWDGRFLARGGESVVLEGAFPGSRVVVLEFPSLARAKAFYASPDYQAAKQKRIGHADFNMVAVDGT
jgi:uncharacterized protein (DUF1330 family)